MNPLPCIEDDVVHRDAGQVLRAEAVHEHPDGVDVDDHVVLERRLLDVEAVLEARAAARQHANAQAGRVGRHLLGLDELPHLFRRLVGQDQLESGGLGVRGRCWSSSLLPNLDREHNSHCNTLLDSNNYNCQSCYQGDSEFDRPLSVQSDYPFGVYKTQTNKKYYR